MAVSAVSDLYLRYKIGTKRVAQWLTDTTAPYKSISTFIAQPTSKSKSKKKSKSPATTNSSTLALTTRDLVAMAKAVSSNANGKRPPPPGIVSIIIILEDVIAGRRECAAWYRQKIAATSVESDVDAKDRTHEHFVDVLREVLSELRLAQGRSQAKNKKKKLGKFVRLESDTMTNDSLCNTYARLSVEESTRSTTFDLPVLRKCAPADDIPSQQDVAFEVEDPEEEKRFALWCLLKDFHSIRLYLQGIWKEYGSGDMSLNVAAQITNNAFLMYHSAQDEFTEAFPDLASYDKVAMYLDIRVSSANDQIQTFSYKAAGADGTVTADATPSDLLCIPAVTVLTIARARLYRAHAKSTETVETDKLLDAAFLAAPYHKLGENIFSVFADLDMLCLHPEKISNLQNGDVFLNDLMGLRCRSLLSLSLVAESQVYMDIYDTLGSTEQHDFRLLCEEKERIKNALARFDQDTKHIEDLDCFNNQLLRLSPKRDLITQCITYGLETPLCQHIEPEGHGQMLGSAANQYPLIAKFPVFAGYLGSWLADLKHLDGIDACGFGLVVVISAHLYSACRRTGMITAEWQDMEFLLDRHTSKAFGLRDIPATNLPILAAAKHYGLALGVPLKNYAARPLGRQRITFPVRVHTPTLRQLNYQRAARLQPTSAFLEAAIETNWTNKRLGFSPRDSVHQSLHSMVEKLLGRPGNEIGKEIQEQWESTKKLTPFQLLNTLRATLVADEVQTQFDYHGFFLDCAMLLGKIKALCRITIMNRWTVEGITASHFMLYEMVDEILWQAADNEALPKKTKRGKIMLADAADVLNEYIGEKGGDYLGVASQVSSGHLVESMRPPRGGS